MTSNTFSALADRDQSRLVIIDMQEKLAPAMEAAAMQAVTRNCGILLQAAEVLGIPALHTEQYPQGLGPTLAALGQPLAGKPCVAKTAFSSCREPAFNRQLTSDRPQIVLAGMEAHICVLQTAMHLHQQGKQVFVVEDAVISRNPANKANALARLRQAGIIVASTESIVFEWLGVAEGDAFKQLSKLIR